MEFFYYRLLGFSKHISQFNKWEVSSYNNPEKWQNHQEELKKVIKFCQKENISLSIVIFPYLQFINPQKDYPYTWIHKKVKKFFQEKDIVVIDMLEILKNYPDKKLIVNPLDYHPSKFVHQKTAERLLQLLQILQE